MKKTSKKIVFFGNEKLATGIPTAKPIIRNAVVAAGFEIEQHITGKLSELLPHEAQLAVLAAYGHIIPGSVLEQFPLGIINVHPSLLPLFRGPTPVEQAILDGVTTTGVSIMRLTAGMDEGPVYKQKSVRLTGKESKAQLATQLQKLGSELLVEVLPEIAAGTLNPRQQPHPDRATYSQLLVKEDGHIDWQKSAQQIEREVRAFAGWPGSRTVIAGKEVIIIAAEVDNAEGAAGTTAVRDKALIVFCGQGSLVIKRLKPAGKSEMTAQAFLAGYGTRI
jgi:methionyl-tRNA formyltransferase